MRWQDCEYLDLFRDADTMGKPTGTDIRDGRRSYAVSAWLAALGGLGAPRGGCRAR
ncbi:hypothetical protein ACOBQB_01070 [Streptomyces sp. G5(2025)]|uniref:hypothetical protein n=1 Tax=Streptomyces sp. G5(2025) TaxID=3406628 RepID=UPI003C17F60C